MSGFNTLFSQTDHLEIAKREAREISDITNQMGLADTHGTFPLKH